MTERTTDHVHVAGHDCPNPPCDWQGQNAWSPTAAETVASIRASGDWNDFSGERIARSVERMFDNEWIEDVRIEHEIGDGLFDIVSVRPAATEVAALRAQVTMLREWQADEVDEAPDADGWMGAWWD